MVSADAVFPARIHEDVRAENICPQEYLRRLNRAVDVRLRRKVHDDVGALLRKDRIHRFAVRDVSAHESKLRIPHRARKRFHIACVGEFVHTEDLVIRVVFQFVVNEVRADKSGAARHQQFHVQSPSFTICCKYLPYSFFASGAARRSTCSASM